MNNSEYYLGILINNIEEGLDIELATVELGKINWLLFMKHFANGLQKVKQELDKNE